MKRLRRRTLISILLAMVLAVGVAFFCIKLVRNGDDWVGFFGTKYYSSGAIYDANGTVLYNGQTKTYAENARTRIATLHLVGDENFGTSLRSVLASRLTGYNFVTGTSLGSHDVTLTVDASLNETAYAALNGHKGVVAVYDYTTGAVKCLVSAPSYDPNNPPSNIDGNPAYDGVYLNRFFSGTFPPGSTFKLITTAAAIEQKKDLVRVPLQLHRQAASGGRRDHLPLCPRAEHGHRPVPGLLLQRGLRYPGHGGAGRQHLAGSTCAEAGRPAGQPQGLRHQHGQGQLRGRAGRQRPPGLVRRGPGQGPGEPLRPHDPHGRHRQRGGGRGPQAGGQGERRRARPSPPPSQSGKETYSVFSQSTCQRLKAMMRNNVAQPVRAEPVRRPGRLRQVRHRRGGQRRAARLVHRIP